MAHGLEARSPFLDHELAEFCASLPPSFKLRGTKRRVIQNKLAERYLPESILTRDKQGFSSAFPYMMAQQFHRLYETLLRDASLVRAGVLEPEPIERLLREQATRKADHGTRLWLLCNAELWYRLGIEDRGVETVRDEIRAAVGDAAGAQA
jgi:asparagine synthase (glutamine-hydrolysing)